MGINKNNNSSQFVCYGEILWDVLPGKKLPGGAPMNVAYHLQKLGKNAGLISKIGNDKSGDELIRIFNDKKININYCQVDNKHITGVVKAIEKENNEMVYEIIYPVAWDFIEWNETISRLVQQADYFVFGSLITRNEQSKNTLFKLLKVAKVKVFDVNLRSPHFNRDIIEELLVYADILKLNLSELKLIAGWFSNYSNEIDAIKTLKELFNISTFIVTKGEDGAILNIDNLNYDHKGFKVQVADTIGSGDSFLAAILNKLSDNFSPEEALAFACGVGALVASKPGGCPDYEISEVTNMINEQ